MIFKYRNYNHIKPVLSGGQLVTSNWTIHDSTKNIYKTTVGTSINTRQLVVNGERAVRAKGNKNPSGFTKTSTGYTLPSSGIYSGMASWGNKNHIEVLSFNEWKDFHCPAASISGSTMTMQTPCWTNAQLTGWPMKLPTYIENAYELLDEEGEWYLNRSSGVLFYKPRAGENMSTAEVIIPKAEKLIVAEGTIGSPVRYIQFQGITFAHSTWLRPSTSEGFAAAQAGYHRIGNNEYVKTPAAISFKMGRNIRFERNTFQHIGSTALEFWYGSLNNTIIGNIYDNISGAAVHIGGIEDDDHHPSNDELTVKNNSITNNYIANVAQDYHNNVAVFAGYTENSTISRNEIRSLPYSAISVGWGWGTTDPGGSRGYTTPTTSKNNQIQYNRIYDYMKVLKDGGGIYTLGAMSGTSIANNYITHIHNNYGQIYLDQASKYIT